MTTVNGDDGALTRAGLTCGETVVVITGETAVITLATTMCGDGLAAAKVCAAGACRVGATLIWLFFTVGEGDTDDGVFRDDFLGVADFGGAVRGFSVGAPVDGLVVVSESAGFASAIPGVVATAAPTPSATANAPTRPT